ncbi:ribokinase [Enterococcus haemoperoxidus ATCC BAA-382]|uniref:Ribokinase n=1 Tax=Enterococcus haemoperoxidus ATCC BAA-382 TaxID=1158608 RepID=R2SXL5_9ENTE|nr:ribokinase [Enterococcus haemoperoxidus]EOH99960.1 ribokinase [Enterococcus haemoperoxidus ATCC BAA-382]EOT63049.1 ribokinase [Enterococcus haemoperoxidus ATCC BAA-382]OJG54593.1 ribokinase [Enterococcus haemoperoxidus]
MNKVTVLGSINMDMVMETDRLPKVGETLLGDSINYYVGGKGANQAVAAARIGVDVALIGKIGDDTFGSKVYKHLEKEKVDVSAVTSEKNIFTGVASIFKLQEDNAIVVLPGANMLLGDINEELNEKIKAEDVLLTQLEIPIETVKKGLALAKDKGAITILNPAPYNESVIDMLPFVDIITPNETEFEGLLGHSITDTMQFEKEMLDWSKTNDTQLIVTRGGDGISYTAENNVITIPAEKVTVVDTTGAGDTFNGILAACLAKGMTVSESVEISGKGATLSVTKLGAQTGMPTLTEIAAF